MSEIPTYVRGEKVSTMSKARQARIAQIANGGLCPLTWDDVQNENVKTFIHDSGTVWRRNGQIQKKAGVRRLPIKFGLKDHGYITETDLDGWYYESEAW